MRTFFALWPDDDMRAQLARAAADLPSDCRKHGVPQENYHLTLAFVGEVAMTQLEELRRIGAAQRACRFTICFDTYEHWREPQVVVAAARENSAALLELWTALHRALRQSSAAPRLDAAATPLRAHVTLARKVAQAPVLKAMSPFRWSARSFSLVSSDTRGAHSVYTVVDTWSLLDEN